MGHAMAPLTVSVASCASAPMAWGLHSASERNESIMRELSKDLRIMRPDRTGAKAEVVGAVIALGPRHHARSLGVLVRLACVAF